MKGSSNSSKQAKEEKTWTFTLTHTHTHGTTMTVNKRNHDDNGHDHDHDHVVGNHFRLKLARIAFIYYLTREHIYYCWILNYTNTHAHTQQ